MKEFKNFTKALEGLPWIVRLILTIFYDIFGNLTRLSRSLAKNHLLGIVLCVILLICGGLIVLWIVDIICVALNKDIIWID